MLDPQYIARVVNQALSEDVGEGDITTRLIVPEGVLAEAEVISREEGRIAGLRVAAAVFAAVDSSTSFRATLDEGEEVKPGDVVARISGPARAIFVAERTALNFLQHMSGIATLTARFVAQIQGSRANIYDTRKTLPGLRKLEKYAVAVGGGFNHRSGLFDAILIKDNHLKAAGGVAEAVERAKLNGAGWMVEVEVEDFDELNAALDAGADVILLDNMDPTGLAEAVRIADGRALLEASGGISLENVKEIAATGVDRISIGRITQGAEPLDLSLEVIRVENPS